MADNSLHPNRRYPQAMGQFLTAAQLRERWGLTNNTYLDALAGTGELLPSKHGMTIYTRKRGWKFEFGIPPEPNTHDTDPDIATTRIFDADLIEWVSTLTDDVVYGLPFVLEHEDQNPQVIQQGQNRAAPVNEAVAPANNLHARVMTVPREQDFFPVCMWLDELVYAVYSPDEKSQEAGTLLGTLSLWFEKAVDEGAIKLRDPETRLPVERCRQPDNFKEFRAVINFADLVRVGQEIGVRVERKPQGEVHEYSLTLLSPEEQAALDARVINGGAPYMRLRRFINLVGEDYIFLMLESGLPAYDGVFDSHQVDAAELIQVMRAPENRDDDDVDFRWDRLGREQRFVIFRDDVESWFKKHEKKKFPWASLNGETVWLDVAALPQSAPQATTTGLMATVRPPEPASSAAAEESAPVAVAKPASKEVKLYDKQAAIDVLSSFVKDSSKLPNLFKNASKYPELQACRHESDGWDLVALFGYLSRKGHLKPEHQSIAGKSAFEKSLV